VEVRQSSGQRLSGEQLQSSQAQLSHSQSGLLQLDTDHLLPIFGLREYVELPPHFYLSQQKNCTKNYCTIRN